MSRPAGTVRTVPDITTTRVPTMPIPLTERRSFTVTAGHIADAVQTVLGVPRDEDVLLIFNDLVLTIAPEDDEAAVIVRYMLAVDRRNGPPRRAPVPGRIPRDAQKAYIARLTERMRSDAATGMPTAQLNRTNFGSLAVSAVLELDHELSFFPG